MFARKFVRLADSFPDVAFCEVFGDENSATRVRYRLALCSPKKFKCMQHELRLCSGSH